MADLFPVTHGSLQPLVKQCSRGLSRVRNVAQALGVLVQIKQPTAPRGNVHHQAETVFRPGETRQLTATQHLQVSTERRLFGSCHVLRVLETLGNEQRHSMNADVARTLWHPEIESHSLARPFREIDIHGSWLVMLRVNTQQSLRIFAVSLSPQFDRQIQARKRHS